MIRKVPHMVQVDELSPLAVSLRGEGISNQRDKSESECTT